MLFLIPKFFQQIAFLTCCISSKNALSSKSLYLAIFLSPKAFLWLSQSNTSAASTLSHVTKAFSIHFWFARFFSLLSPFLSFLLLLSIFSIPFFYTLLFYSLTTQHLWKNLKQLLNLSPQKNHFLQYLAVKLYPRPLSKKKHKKTQDFCCIFSKHQGDCIFLKEKNTIFGS